MALAEEKFNPRPCRRCGTMILVGIHDGLPWRVELGVTSTAAAVLDHYGHGVVELENRPGGLWAGDYDPQRQPDPPRTYLAVSHVCGSAHAQQMTERQRWNNRTQ